MSKPIILIVDDMPSNIDVLRSILSEDYRLKVATNGEVGIKAALANPRPDLILLDIIMPGMDGFEVYKRLKQDKITSKIPVIFVTGADESSMIDKVKSLDAVEFVTKPPNPVELKEKIGKSINF